MTPTATPATSEAIDATFKWSDKHCVYNADALMQHCSPAAAEIVTASTAGVDVTQFGTVEWARAADALDAAADALVLTDDNTEDDQLFEELCYARETIRDGLHKACLCDGDAYERFVDDLEARVSSLPQDTFLVAHQGETAEYWAWSSDLVFGEMDAELTRGQSRYPETHRFVLNPETGHGALYLDGTWHRIVALRGERALLAQHWCSLQFVSPTSPAVNAAELSEEFTAMVWSLISAKLRLRDEPRVNDVSEMPHWRLIEALSDLGCDDVRVQNAVTTLAGSWTGAIADLVEAVQATLPD